MTRERDLDVYDIFIKYMHILNRLFARDSEIDL